MMTLHSRLLVLLTFLSMISTGIAGERPNIVLIVSDDHGTDALGSYGNEVIETPNLDALAEEGTRFTRAFATTSSCSPSRAVLLTGLHNHANGQYGLEHWQNHFASFDDVRSLPVILREAGYRTARIGKYHVAPAKVYDFDVVLSKGAANDMASVARSPVQMAEMAADFIASTEEPFFLFYATDDPHRSYPFDTAPKPNRFGNREEGYPGVEETVYSPDDVLIPDYLPDLPETRAEFAEYYQSVSRVDKGVGALVDTIRQAGRYDDTVIIYLSDNGIAFPGAKTTLYDPGIRLPLIVKASDAKAGAVSDALVSWVDITPTILAYAGIDDLSGFHGVSIRPALRGEGLQGREAIYGSHSFHTVIMYYPMRMIRTERYKLIMNIAHPLPFPFAADLMLSTTYQGFQESGTIVYGQRDIQAFRHRPKFELYDLSADPGEVRNLAKEPAYRSTLDDLVERLKAFQHDTEDPWRVKWDYE